MVENINTKEGIRNYIIDYLAYTLVSGVSTNDTTQTNRNASEDVKLFSGAQAKENTQTNRNASEDVKLFSGAQAKENTPIENNSEEVINNEVWLIKSGFRRAFHFHNVFCNKETNEYAFHVSDGDLYNQRYDDFPNFGRYPNYYDMLDGVVEKYAKLWKIE